MSTIRHARTGKLRRTMLRRLYATLREVTRDRRGASAVMLGATLPIVIGFVGLGLDTGVWYKTKRTVQNSADAAAISAAMERVRGNTGALTSSATKEATRNGWTSASPSTITVHNPPTSGPNTSNTQAVEVLLTAQQPSMFSRIFHPAAATIGARAVAGVKTNAASDVCVLSLDSTATNATYVQGSASINVNGCVVAANSKAAGALTISGNATLTAASTWTTGTHQVTGSAVLNTTSPPMDRMWPLPDPYSSLSVPTLGSCDHTKFTQGKGTITISPGVYCNGIDFGSKAVVHMNPGTYYIDKGNFNVNAQATVDCNCSASGSGVTIVLTSSAADHSGIGTVTINGGANIALTAPADTGYSYPGVLFFQDRNAGTTDTNKFNGGADMDLGGAIYFPQQLIEWSGDTGVRSPSCTQIIARLITFIGNNNTIINDSGCASGGGKRINTTVIGLIE